MAYVPEQGTQLKATKAYSWFKEARSHMTSARREADNCCAYYDNEQWTKSELNELEDREQPATTKNHIKPTLDLVLGTETKVRVDYKALPKTGLHVEDANVVTHLMKHAMDQCKGEYVFSAAFNNMVKAGWSVVEIFKENDPFKDPVAIRMIHRDHIYWDPFSREWDWGDGKYVIRAKWLDIDDAIAKFPEFAEALRAAVDSDKEQGYKQPYEITGDETDPHGSIFDWEEGNISSKDWIDSSRKRVRILEVWYKAPTTVFILEDLTTGEKTEFDFRAPGALDRLMGEVKIYQATINKIRLGLVAGPNVMQDDWSPYRHNRFPFVPFWGFVRDKDNTPYGLILQMKSPQDEINKRASKALHILNTAQIVTDEKDEERIEEMRKEAAKPDGVVRKRKDSDTEIHRDTALAEAQFRMYRDAIDQINMVSGINADMMAQETNAKSGKAIQSRIVQGNTLLASIFDNYRRSRQLVGEIVFALIQQYYTAAKEIRITDQGQVSFVTLNQPLVDEETGRSFIRNDITQARVDIKIDEEAYHATIREALMEQMMDLVGKLSQTMPMVALALLDLVASYSDVPGRDEIVARIRQIQAAAGVVGQEQPAPEAAA